MTLGVVKGSFRAPTITHPPCCGASRHAIHHRITLTCQRAAVVVLGRDMAVAVLMP